MSAVVRAPEARFPDLTLVRCADPTACPFCRARTRAARCRDHASRSRGPDTCPGCLRERAKLERLGCPHARTIRASPSEIARPAPGDGVHVIAQGWSDGAAQPLVAGLHHGLEGTYRSYRPLGPRHPIVGQWYEFRAPWDTPYHLASE